MHVNATDTGEKVDHAKKNINILLRIKAAKQTLQTMVQSFVAYLLDRIEKIILAPVINK